MSATHLVEFHGLPVFDLPAPDAAVPLPAADAVAWRVRYDWNGSEEFEAVSQRFLDTVRTEDVCALIIGAWGEAASDRSSRRSST